VQYFFQKRTQRSLGDEANISQPAMKKRIDKAVDELRLELKKKGVFVAIPLLLAFLTQGTAQAAVPVALSASLTKIGLAGVGSSQAAGTSAALAGTAKAGIGFLSTAAGKAAIGIAATVAIIGVTWVAIEDAGQQNNSGRGIDDPRMVLWLTCEQVVDNKIMPDESGMNNDALLRGLADTNLVSIGRDNHAMRFRKGFLQIKNNPSLQLGHKAYTLSAWCKPEAVNEKVEFGIITKIKDSSNKEYGLLFGGENKATLIVEKDDRHERIEIQQPMQLGQWHHIVATFDASLVGNPTNRAARMYVNGRAVDIEGRITQLPEPSDIDVQIGHFFAAGYNRYFIGVMDDIRIYNEALNEAEIRALWNNPPATEMKRPRNAEWNLYET